MFEPTKNDGYYQLGLEAAAVIREAIANRRPGVDTTVVESSVRSQTKITNVDGEQQCSSGTGESSDLLL
jgi:hypothetical protein